MASTWAQLLGDAEAAPESEDEGRGLFGRLRDSLAKSRRALTEQIVVAAFDPADDEAWERLEGGLVSGGVGVRAPAALLRRPEARAGSSCAAWRRAARPATSARLSRRRSRPCSASRRR